MRTWQEGTEMRPEVGVEAGGTEWWWWWWWLGWWCRGELVFFFFVPTFDYSGWLN